MVGSVYLLKDIRSAHFAAYDLFLYEDLCGVPQNWVAFTSKKVAAVVPRLFLAAIMCA